MKKYLLALPVFIIVQFLHAQEPSVKWAQVFSGTVQGWSVAIDTEGNAFISGIFWDSLTIGKSHLVAVGGADCFIAKFDARGNSLWATQAGGKGDDNPSGIAVDAVGNCYLAGQFSGNALFGNKSVTSTGSSDGFLAKFDVQGNCKWASKVGADGSGWSEGVTTDAHGNIYLTGNFQSKAAFGTQPYLVSYGYEDMFIAKYDSNGICLWAAHGGGGANDEGRGVSVDAIGNVYVMGLFCGGTGQFGNTTLSSMASQEMFIAKYDTAGNLLWARQAQGTLGDAGYGISTDAAGYSTITGSISSTATIDQFQLPFNSTMGGNAFIARYDTKGDCQWASSIGGSGFHVGNAVSVDVDGNSFVTGFYSGQVVFGDWQFNSPESRPINSTEAYIAKYDARGKCLWAKSSGGIGVNMPYGITIDGKGSVWVAGLFSGNTIFDQISLTGPGAYLAEFADGVMSVNEPDKTGMGIPTTFELMQNFPNPFNPSTTISFSLPSRSFVTLKIFDVMGREVATMVSEEMTAGNYSQRWNASSYPSGVYFYRLQAGNFNNTKRLLFLK
jgi:hypothetical protein